jgi:biopolymer transport protein ExbB/TolQ
MWGYAEGNKTVVAIVVAIVAVAAVAFLARKLWRRGR